MSQQISFVPADLLDDIDPAATYARRLLVTSWVLSDGQEDADGVHARAAVEFWQAHAQKLNAIHWATATVTTVLFELIELGLIDEIEDVAGGFDVALRAKEAA